jgi:hypothetical protein
VDNFFREKNSFIPRLFLPQRVVHVTSITLTFFCFKGLTFWFFFNHLVDEMLRFYFYCSLLACMMNLTLSIRLISRPGLILFNDQITSHNDQPFRRPVNVKVSKDKRSLSYSTKGLPKQVKLSIKRHHQIRKENIRRFRNILNRDESFLTLSNSSQFNERRSHLNPQDDNYRTSNNDGNGTEFKTIITWYSGKVILLFSLNSKYQNIDKTFTL